MKYKVYTGNHANIDYLVSGGVIIYDWWNKKSSAPGADLEYQIAAVTINEIGGASDIEIGFDTVEQFHNWFLEEYFLYLL